MVGGSFGAGKVNLWEADWTQPKQCRLNSNLTLRPYQPYMGYSKLHQLFHWCSFAYPHGLAGTPHNRGGKISPHSELVDTLGWIQCRPFSQPVPAQVKIGLNHPVFPHVLSTIRINSEDTENVIKYNVHAKLEVRLIM